MKGTNTIDLWTICSLSVCVQLLCAFESGLPVVRRAFMYVAISIMNNEQAQSKRDSLYPLLIYNVLDADIK